MPTRAGDTEMTQVLDTDPENGLAVRMGIEGKVRYLELRTPDGEHSLRVETERAFGPDATDAPVVLVSGSRRTKLRYQRGEVVEEGASRPYVDRDLQRVFAHRVAPYESLDPEIRSRIEGLTASDRAAGDPVPRGFFTWVGCMSDMVGAGSGLGAAGGAVVGGIKGAAAGAAAGAAVGASFGLGYCTTAEITGVR